DLARAQAILMERLRLAKELKDRNRLIRSLAHLGEVLIEREDCRSARAYLEQGVRAVQEDGADARRNELPELLRSVAAYATAQGQPDRAARLLGAAAAHQVALGPLDSYTKADCQALLAAPRKTLGEAAFTTAWEAGQALASEQALALLAE